MYKSLTYCSFLTVIKSIKEKVVVWKPNQTVLLPYFSDLSANDFLTSIMNQAAIDT